MRLVALALLGPLLAGCAGASQGRAPRMNSPAFDPALVLPIVKWPAEQPRPLSPMVNAAETAAGTPADPADGTAPLKPSESGPPDGAVLRQIATPWTAADGDIAPLLARMHATLVHSGGVGIAAPQVGVSRRVFLVKHGTRPPGQPTRIVAYINPQVLWASPEPIEDYEACLSVHGVGGLLPRAGALRVRYQAAEDPSGPPREVEASGWDARIFQHELDHIDGRLYIDHVARLGRALVPIDEMRKQRDALHRQRGLLP
jgi:peptide deformylase